MAGSGAGNDSPEKNQDGKISLRRCCFRGWRGGRPTVLPVCDGEALSPDGPFARSSQRPSTPPPNCGGGVVQGRLRRARQVGKAGSNSPFPHAVHGGRVGDGGRCRCAPQPVEAPRSVQLAVRGGVPSVTVATLEKRGWPPVALPSLSRSRCLQGSCLVDRRAALTPDEAAGRGGGNGTRKLR